MMEKLQRNVMINKLINTRGVVMYLAEKLQQRVLMDDKQINLVRIME